MLIAQSRIEIAQIRKLLYAIRISDYEQIQRLHANGVDDIINYNDPISGN
jgi:hypothetical protein